MHSSDATDIKITARKQNYRPISLISIDAKL
jgi:hypothetical protein